MPHGRVLLLVLSFVAASFEPSWTAGIDGPLSPSQGPSFEERLAAQLYGKSGSASETRLSQRVAAKGVLQKVKVKGMLSSLLGIQTTHLSSFESEANRRLKDLIRENAGNIIAVIADKDDNWLKEQLKIAAMRHAQDEIDKDMKGCGRSGCTITIYNQSDSVDVAAWRHERTPVPTVSPTSRNSSTVVNTTIIVDRRPASVTPAPTFLDSVTTTVTVRRAPRISPEFIRTVMRKLADKLSQGDIASKKNTAPAASLYAAMERRLLAAAAHETLLQLERQLSSQLTHSTEELTKKVITRGEQVWPPKSKLSELTPTTIAHSHPVPVRSTSTENTKLAFVHTTSDGNVDITTKP